MSKLNQQGINALILVGCISLLQVHGAIFWVSAIGLLGLGWSFLLELIGLWLWYKPKFSYRLLAALVSLITLAAPIYQVTHPVIDSHLSNNYEVSLKNKELHNLNAEKQRLIQQLETYEENSKARTGWLTAINAANERLKAIDAEINLLEKHKPQLRQLSVSWVIIMEVIGLIIFQLVAVLAILNISKNAHNSIKTPHNLVVSTAKSIKQENPPKGTFIETPIENFFEPEPKSEPEPVKPEVELQPITVLNKLIEYLKKQNKNFKEFSEASGVSAKDLSFLRNHKKREEEGERTISAAALTKINDYLMTKET